MKKTGHRLLKKVKGKCLKGFFSKARLFHSCKEGGLKSNNDVSPYLKFSNRDLKNTVRFSSNLKFKRFKFVKI